MNGIALIIGIALFIAGVLIPTIGITDVSHNTESIIASMVFLSGCICLSMAGANCKGD